MSRKRKTEITVLDELDRTMFSTFSASANSLYQLYALAQSHQKAAFQDGERHGLEKLHHWILERQGGWLSEADVLAYIENELGYNSGDASMELPSQSRQPPTVGHMHEPAPAIPMPHGANPANNAKPVYSTAMPSPLTRALQPPFDVTSGGNHCSSGHLGSQSRTVGSNPEVFMPQSYTCLPQRQDSVMHMYHEDPYQQFYQ